MGCHALLQGVFPTQGLNPDSLWLLHWEADSLTLSHLGIPWEETDRCMSGGDNLEIGYDNKHSQDLARVGDREGGFASDAHSPRQGPA